MSKRSKGRTVESELDRQHQIKKLVVIAMFSDDDLMERLALKGGNALNLVHGIDARASVDIDLSMENDFGKGELDSVRVRVETALQNTFNDAGYEVFDVRMTEQPRGLTPDMADFWGGYSVEFKLIEMSQYQQFSSDIGELRKRALQLGQGQKFLIEISKHEYILNKEAQELEGHRIFVYTPEMIVCEKLRAICQQMPEYGPIIKRRRPGSPRARDFLDIHTLVVQLNLDMATTTNLELLRQIFKAKRVPLALLACIQEHRDFHRTDFPAVRATIRHGVQIADFDFYFDFVVSLAARLEPFRNM